MNPKNCSYRKKQQYNYHQQQTNTSFVVSLTNRNKCDQVNDYSKNLQNLEDKEEKKEEFVLLSYAGSHPRAVMVKSGNTPIATMTVLDPQWLVGLAQAAVSFDVGQLLCHGAGL